MTKALIIIILLTITTSLCSQSLTKYGAGYGYVSGRNYYEYYTNPKVEGDTTLRTSGSVAGIFWGTKAWVGTKRYSVSVEGQLNFAPFAFDTQEFKGIGAMSIPFIARFNIGALSGKNMIATGKGFSVGVGVQYSRTELLFTPKEFKNLERKFYKSYIVEVVFGSGQRRLGHFGYFARYGFSPDDFSTASIGFFALTSGFSVPRIIRPRRVFRIIKSWF